MESRFWKRPRCRRNGSRPRSKAGVRRGLCEEAPLAAISETKVRVQYVFAVGEIPHHINLSPHCDMATCGVLLAHSPLTHMNAVLTLSGLMLLCASVVTGAGTLMHPAQTRIDLHSVAEPAGLVAFGTGFVLLAKQVRRKEKC